MKSKPKAQIEHREIARIIPYARNPRRNDAAVSGVAASIKEFGFQVPIVVDSEGVIVTGHTRLKAAQQLGLETVPVIEASDLTPEQVKAYRILDNKLSEKAEWDPELLQLELDEIELDLEPFEVDFAEDVEIESPEVFEDEPPPLEANAVSRRGDLWLLGDHRLLCGDSTSGDDVGRLMRQEKAGLMNTDPPYGIAYSDETRVAADRAHVRPNRETKWEEGIENDAVDGEQLQAFLEKCIRSAVPHLIDNTAFYLWHPMLTQGAFFAAAAAAAADILIHRQIIWVKPALLFGFGDYHWRHELCFYGWRRGFRPEFYGERNQTTVWELTHEVSNGNREHPTQKPVELFARPILNHTKPGEIIYEPFAGSGSQLIAAEQLSRRCYGMEIEPRYVDVAIRRWEKLTGKDAALEATGQTFADVAAERSDG